MSRGIPYFDFYPADFMHGVRGLSAQEVGVYTMMLCRIYEENGPVERHDLRLATYCGMREKSFAKALEKLIELGKLVEVDGHITNRRAAAEIASRANKLKKNISAGKASAEKRQEKQREASTDVQHAFNHTDTDTDIRDGGGGDAHAREAEPGPEPAPTKVPAYETAGLRERILDACGVDPISGLTGPSGRMIGTQADMAEVGRWQRDLGLTGDQVVEAIRDVMARKRDGPPSSLTYFRPAMQRLAGSLSEPALSPATVHPLPTRTAHGKPAFGDQLYDLTRRIRAGEINLRVDDDDPFASG